MTIYLILLFTAVMARGETIELTLHPSKAGEPVQAYHLLVDSEKLTDTEAMPLYEKAIQSMSSKVDLKQISDWLRRPIEQFPQEKAEETIQKHIESLRYVAQATRCKKCTWPEWKPGTDPPETNGYRDLTFVIRLWARLEICRGQYKNATVAMQTSLGMAKHLGQAPTIIQTLVGAAAAETTCREIEQFVQGNDAPSLFKALADLPEPFVNMEKAIESEKANLKDYNILTRKLMEKQLDPAHDRTRLIAKRLDNHLNALQVVEAIRHYAAAQDGQLPQTLSDIKDMEIPNDLINGKAFEYRRTSAGAILKSAIPEGGNERDAIDYEIVLKK